MTPQQIAILTAARDAMLTAPSAANAATYYSILAAAGIDYGNLALGVVLDNTLFGILANNYMDNEIVRDKRSSLPTTAEIIALQRDLVNSDFVTRFDLGFSRDLAGQQISDYHDDAFRLAFSHRVEMPETAWTAYHVVRSLGPEAWRLSSNLWLGVPGAKLLYDAMVGVALVGNADQRHHAREWLDDIVLDGVGAASVLEWVSRTSGVGRSWFGDMMQRFGALEPPPLQDGSPVSPAFILHASFLGWASSQASLFVDGRADLPSDFLALNGGALKLDLAKVARP